MSSWKRLKKKYNLHVLALAVLASSAATGCVQQANNDHKAITQAITTYELPAKQEEEVVNLAEYLDGGRIKTERDLSVLKKEIHMALENLPEGRDREFYQGLSALSAQISNYATTLQSITRTIDAAKRNRVPDNAFDTLVLQQMDELNRTTQGLSFGQLCDVLVHVKDTGFQFVFFENELIKYLDAMNSLQQSHSLSSNQMQAFDRVATQQQTVVARTIQKLSN